MRAGDAEAMAQLIWAGLHGANALPINIDLLALSEPARMSEGMLDLLLDWLTRQPDAADG